MNTDLLHQLAQGWLDCAEADEDDALTRPEIRVTFNAYARVRSNCAMELKRLLFELQKENPPIGGPLATETDSESV